MLDQTSENDAQAVESQNPFAAPQTFCQAELDSAAIHIRSVARAFKVIGWTGIVLYIPVILSMVSIAILMVYQGPIESPLFFAGVALFHGTVFALFVFYVKTGRRLSNHDLTARRHAVLLSCLMMLGFPLFTVIGILCYRKIKRYFNEDLVRPAKVA